MNSEQQEKSTPRPWTWQNFGSGPLLTSCVSGRPIVMDFVRKGMHGAEPRFGKRTDSMGGIMVPLSEWESLPPDAELIVTAVNEREALLKQLAELKEIAVIAVTLHHGGCYQHKAHEVRYEDCENAICARTRRALHPERPDPLPSATLKENEDVPEIQNP